MKNMNLIILVSASMLSSCGEKIVYTLNVDTINLIREQTFKLEVIGGKIPFETIFIAGDDNVASVDSLGIVKGEHVGTSVISVYSEVYLGQCLVTVHPVYHTFAEPVGQFGATKNDIKSREKRVLFFEDGESLIFNGANSEASVSYFFDGFGKFDAARVMVSTQNSNEVTAFFTERYYVLSGDPMMYLSLDRTCRIGIYTLDYPGYWMILYSPNL
jgi:hypothetical protein